MSARLHTVAPAPGHPKKYYFLGTPLAGAGQPHLADAGHTNAATPAFAGVTGI